MFLSGIEDLDIAAGGHRGRHVRGDLDPVFYDPVQAPRQGLHALDDDATVGFDHDHGAHLLQEEHQVDDLQLIAAFSITVVPWAVTAASSRFSVAPTEG